MISPEKNMRKLAALIFTFCLLAASAYAADDKYTMEDLQVLSKEGNYIEVLQHMNDIRPTKRDDNWKAIVQTAVVKTLEKQLTAEDPYSAVNFCEQMLDTQPALKELKPFIDLRRKAVIKGFTLCYRNSYDGSQCTENLRGIVKKVLEDHELAFQAAKLVRLNSHSSVAVPFFIQALKDNPDRKICADEDLIYAVQSGIGMPPDRAKESLELGFSICFDTLKPHLMEDFYESHGYALNNYCLSLKKKNALTEFQSAFCADQL